MPFVSKKQQAWGHTEAGTKALGGAAKVAEWDQAGKSYKKLPERVRPKRKNGQISDRAAARHLSTSNGATNSAGGKDPDNLPGVTS